MNFFPPHPVINFPPKYRNNSHLFQRSRSELTRLPRSSTNNVETSPIFYVCAPNAPPVQHLFHTDERRSLKQTTRPKTAGYRSDNPLDNYSFYPSVTERKTTRPAYQSIYNMHAKSGFKYWYQEYPKPTKFGRYGMGSYKTIHGLGSAPRT